MNNKKIGVTLAVIIIASVFAIMPFPAAVQAGTDGGSPPGTPTLDDNQKFGVTDLQPGAGKGYGTTLRVYGEEDEGPVVGYFLGKGQFIYPNYWDPFDPTSLQKDVLVFNPAVVKYTDPGFSAQQASGKNAYVKKFMRLWYEPEHEYTKSHYIEETIEVETTYMLIYAQHYTPTHGEADITKFAFPIAEKPLQTGLGAFENTNFIGLHDSSPNLVNLRGVSGNVSDYNKTTNGTIRLEKGYALTTDQKIQFLDHKLTFKWIVQNPEDKKLYAKVVMEYAGNIHDDSESWVTLGEFDDGTPKGPTKDTYFDRHNNRYGTASHAEHRTWYARYAGKIGGTYNANIIVGKEISAGDTFYVNAVRYDVPAIEVLDTDGNGTNGAEGFKYITLRTPLPKRSTSVLIPDDGKVSSQWIDTIAPYEYIPVNPPFNDNYTMIDDINIVLWKPTAHHTEWPEGTYNGPASIGQTYWPWAERYLTMQEEEIQKELWCANDSIPVGQNWLNYFQPEEGGWVTNPALREVPSTPPLSFCYVKNDDEPRYTTELYERLMEDLPDPTVTPGPSAPPKEYWITTYVKTKPDDYAEFALPIRPEATTAPLTKRGDYLLTTSFLAKNSINRSDIVRTPPGLPRVTFAFDVLEEDDVLEMTTPMGDGQDIYVNRYTNVSSSVRIYGEKDYGPIGEYGCGYPYGGTHMYEDYTYPFNPAAIRKDSITFNPAIIQNKDIESSGKNQFMTPPIFNAEVKKYLRMWYEPDHIYSKSEACGYDLTYKYPTIEVESTYLLIDRQDKNPASSLEGFTHFAFPIAEDRNTPYPAVGLELFENPNSRPKFANRVTVAKVDGEVAAWNKTTNGTIRLEKVYTLAPGESVQFLNFGLQYWYINEFNQSSVTIWYMGNPEDVPEIDNVSLGTIANPQEITWFDREGNHYTGEAGLSHPQQIWYAKLNTYSLPYGDQASFTVGIELRPRDLFYVDGVRYDVEAIEVIDGDGNASNGAELFKYITLRTPLPKRDGIFVTEDDERVDDDGIISSQEIWTYPPNTILPLNPPFNGRHDIVDDISDTCLGDVADRIIEDYPALGVYYINEAIEPRYSTNLLEVLTESITGTAPIVESWTKYDIITRPDQYTVFVLPGDETRWNFGTESWDDDLYNEYLITTSFLAPNAVESDLMDLSWPWARAAFVFDVFNTQGIYINEIEAMPPGPPADAPTVNCNLTPAGNVSSAEWLTATVNATHFKWPLTVKVAWDDGAESAGVLTDASDVFMAQHRYLAKGEYTVEAFVTDIYGNTGNCVCGVVNVTSDGFRYVIKPGWNMISIPVNDTITVDDVFDPGNNTWFTSVWRWNASLPGYESLTGSAELKSEWGLFVFGPPCGTEELIVTGTAAGFTRSGWQSGWNLVGPGFDQVIVPEWVYFWDAMIYNYDVGHTMDPGRGYWVFI
ncbi:MAG: hypothetical protein JW945_05970 [Methanomicrobia archaeon]|nr:hypothetical protein [Methanomicrobia archaeon]